MTDFIKIALGALAGASLSNLSYLGQKRLESKRVNRTKIRMILRLLDESIKLCKLQVQSLSKYLSELPNDADTVPSLEINSYTAITDLSTRMVLDDYYHAITREMRGVLEIDQYFFQLKYVSINADVTIKGVLEAIKDFRKTDSELREKFHASLVSCVDTVMELSKIPKMNTHAVAMINLVQARGAAPPANGFGNVPYNVNTVILPLLNYLAGMGQVPHELHPLYIKLLEAKAFYEHLMFNHRDTALLLDRYGSEMADDVNSLIECRKFFRNSQVAGKYGGHPSNAN